MNKLVIFFGICALFFGGCRKKTEADYLATASACVQKQDLAGTVAAYENLLRDYPDGQNAPQALYDLGRIYQDKTDKTLPIDGSDRKAIGFYQRIVDKFPQSKQAPDALFNIGFLYANELQDLQAGKKAYEKFLHDYPNNPLVPSAKFEIENIGVSSDSLTIDTKEN